MGLDAIAWKEIRQHINLKARESWQGKLDRAEWSSITMDVYVAAYEEAYRLGLAEASSHLQGLVILANTGG